MGGVWTQLFPPRPSFTDKDVPSLVGKVYIVTGGNAGVGLELVKILYSKGATVYIAGRSASRIETEIGKITAQYRTSKGSIRSMILDLSDLTTIAPSVSKFLIQESRLDVLFLNAGISNAPAGSITAQGHQLHMGTNCLGPFLLTKLLLPVLTSTAKTAPCASIRVVFTSSGVMEMNTLPGGLVLAEQEPGKHSKDNVRNYSASKAGNWILASEFDKRIRSSGIVCVAQSPGTLKTKGWDSAPWIMRAMMAPVMHDPIMGAYTELWTGLSPQVILEDGGRLSIPWGRWHTSPPADMLQGMKTKEEGGTGLGAEFWDWCEKNTKEFA